MNNKEYFIQRDKIENIYTESLKKYKKDLCLLDKQYVSESKNET